MLVAWICGRRFGCKTRNRTRVRLGYCFRARQPNPRRPSVDNAREGKRTIARKHGHLRVLLLSASESERGFGSVFHHQLKIPTNSPVGIFLLIAACSRASARVHTDFGFSCRPILQHHSALSWPLFSAPSRRPRGRSPQAHNSYFYLFNELRADLLTWFLRSIGSRWIRYALRHRMAAMLRSAVNPYRRPRGTRPVAVG